jgi:hypothetical protein
MSHLMCVDVPVWCFISELCQLLSVINAFHCIFFDLFKFKASNQKRRFFIYIKFNFRFMYKVYTVVLDPITEHAD